MTITLAIGYQDGDTVDWFAQESVAVDTAALIAVMSGPLAGATLRDALKAALYGYLRQAGHIPQEASEG
jgi:hypothetical protein